MKPLIPIVSMSYFLYAGLAYALAVCFEPVVGAHEPMNKLGPGVSAKLPNVEHDEPERIPCADRQLQFGPIT